MAILNLPSWVLPTSIWPASWFDTIPIAFSAICWYTTQRFDRQWKEYEKAVAVTYKGAHEVHEELTSYLEAKILITGATAVGAVVATLYCSDSLVTYIIAGRIAYWWARRLEQWAAISEKPVGHSEYYRDMLAFARENGLI